MTVINIERVISVSSEDPAYPAENLLKSDTKKKWKCRAGEKQASVIMQLKRDTMIDSIDIGNEHSAFVEVLVAKSSTNSSDFQVLLVASSLMSLKESKDGTNISGVRFFKKSDLTKPAVDEKWDRVKIVCTQPFNKHVQYGLSFVVLHSSDGGGGEGESSGAALGRFALKEEEEEQPVAVGSWFAKRKDPPPPVPLGAAAAIRDASSPAAIAQTLNKKKTPKTPKIPTPTNNGVLKPVKQVTPKNKPSPMPKKIQKPTLKENMSIDDEDSPADDTDADSTYSPTKDSASILSDDEIIPNESDEEDMDQSKRPKRKKKDTSPLGGKIINGQTPKRKNTDVTNLRAKVAKSDRETKPFERLLEGVTFAISGYQNPLRGQLRSQACAMGARYRADWDNTCTHLICAFVNTPKFNQVRGRGKIVKKDWIEECHNRRRRLPWRRFCLDRNDIGTSSEEEVWEQRNPPSTSTSATIASGVNRRRVSSGSDTEEEIERVRARQKATKPTTPDSKKAVKPDARKDPGQGDPYDADTDVDSASESQTAALPLPNLPNFFESICFNIGCDIDELERKKLYRYIRAYNGSVVDEVDSSVEYVITRLPEIAAQVAEEFGISAVSPGWVWECSDAASLVPVSDYVL